MPFDEARAGRVVKFFERVLTHTKDPYAGLRFILDVWQRDFLRELFGRVGLDGLRQYETCYLEIAKKNGKTEIGAGVALYMLKGEGKRGVEVYSAAATRDQAGKVFAVAEQMVRNSAALSAELEIIRSSKTILVRDDPSSFYRAISADAGTQDGANPYCVVFDEVHRQKNRDLWDVLKKGMSTRTEPLMFACTTAGVEGESPICFELHQKAIDILAGHYKAPRFYPAVHALGEKEDWTKEGHPAAEGKPATGWYKANPALGSFKRIEKMREEFEDAKRSPSSENSFRRFELNQWVSGVQRWISLRTWDKGKKPFDFQELLGKPCVVGLDLSSDGDITAALGLFPWGDDAIRILPRFWLPREGLLERSKKDNVAYDYWAKQGLLQLTDGDTIDYSYILRDLQNWGELYDVKEIAADPWNALKIQTDLAALGFTVSKCPQTMASLSPPSKEFERLVKLGKILHAANPILRWMVDCVTRYQDGNGNIKPVKPDRLKTKKRIDGVVALIIGLSRLIVAQPDNGSLTDFLSESPVIGA